MAKLNAITIKNLSEPGKYPDGEGLYLFVKNQSSKSWVFRYSFRGTRKEMGLGSSDTLPLSEARKQCHELRRQILDGMDPIRFRTMTRGPKEIKTFEEVALEYLETVNHSWRSEKHSKNWLNSLKRYVFPYIGKTPVSDVNLELVVSIFRPIWISKTETASRTMNRVAKVLGFARVMKYRTGENPALWKDNLEHVFAAKSKVSKVSHMPSMPRSEIKDFYALIAEKDSITAACMRFQMLTVTRSGEATGARWAEIDWEERAWRIPGIRMKGGEDHAVPLSDEALTILRTMKAMSRCEFVFPSRFTGKHLSGMAVVVFMRKLGRSEVPHGFRSTFKDWARDLTTYEDDLSEMALSHQIPDATKAAYMRTTMFEKRRALMQDWADFCLGKKQINAA